jgi:hypothetical protein
MRLPVTRAQIKRVRPKIGITNVFAMNRYLNLETWSQSRGSWIIMKRKKQSICAEVTCALAGMWFGKVLKDGQIACSIVWMHCPL